MARMAGTVVRLGADTLLMLTLSRASWWRGADTGGPNGSEYGSFLPQCNKLFARMPV
jgi:hypothetical protein